MTVYRMKLQVRIEQNEVLLFLYERTHILGVGGPPVTIGDALKEVLPGLDNFMVMASPLTITIRWISDPLPKKVEQVSDDA